MSFFYLLFISAYSYSFSILWIFFIHTTFGVLFNPLEFIVFWIAVICRNAMIYDKKQFNEDFGIEDAWYMDMETVIQIVCSYCQKDMGTKDGNGVTGVSHSICDECAAKILDEFRED